MIKLIGARRERTGSFRFFSFFLFFLISFVPFLRAADVTDYYREGVSALDNGDHDTAIQMFRMAIRENPRVPQLYNALGIAFVKKKGNLTIARRYFEKAVRLDPGYAEPYFNMGTFYAGTANDPILAAEQFEKAVKANPMFGKAYMGLGWINMQKQDARTASENFLKAIETNPELPEAHYGLGLAYVGMKKKELALKPITTLRNMGNFDLAQNLETAVQGPTGDQTSSEGMPQTSKGELQQIPL